MNNYFKYLFLCVAALCSMQVSALVPGSGISSLDGCTYSWRKSNGDRIQLQFHESKSGNWIKSTIYSESTEDAVDVGDECGYDMGGAYTTDGMTINLTINFYIYGYRFSYTDEKVTLSADGKSFILGNRVFNLIGEVTPKMAGGTALTDVFLNSGDSKSRKVVENGKIVILLDGNKYDITGRKL